MLELLLLAGFGVMVVHSISVRDDEFSLLPRKVSDKIGKLWDIAHQGMRENRFLRAEKALLSILKIDEKNAAAYNRLGILYAKQKEYKDAIDCFEIASSIEPSASSLHNLGLIYFETENYPKAATAFEHALKLEDSLAARHIAYAKVQEKLGNQKVMLDELQKAVELEPSQESYRLIRKAYEDMGMQAEADLIAEKMKHSTKHTSHRKKRLSRPKRVVI
ncbi:MAG: tetratricopeptide repeat protein [Candidatus Saccharibacteria bacterium]|nr:tetratricopeptide repeat protein [Candidatus Saccharibacteria bacterium]